MPVWAWALIGAGITAGVIIVVALFLFAWGLFDLARFFENSDL